MNLLTPKEQALITKLGECMGDFRDIAGEGPSRQHDLNEIAAHIHALQDKVLAQAAARAYAGKYRLLGEVT